MIHDFIDLAKYDIESSEILFENNKFSNSLYFYHQSVEKAVKYLGLKIGIIYEDNLKKISHHPIKVFSILDQKENLFNGEGIDDFALTIKQLTDESLVEKTLEAMEDSLIYLFEVDIKKSYFQNFKIYIKDKDFPEKQMLLQIEENEYYNKMAENFFSQLNVGAVILRLLFLNSCLCSKYKLDTYRYISNEITNPIEYFSKNNSIISHFPIFIKSMNLCLSQIKNIDWKNKNYA